MERSERDALDRHITGNGAVAGRLVLAPHRGGRGNKRVDPRPCVDCRELIPPEDARFSNGRLRVRCRPCNTVEMRAWRKVNGKAAKLREYGITPEDHARMLAEQDGVCAVCGDPPGQRSLHVDHDHACCPGWGSCGKCVRGLLCVRCNNALGNFRDDPALLRAAAAYLEGARNGSA